MSVKYQKKKSHPEFVPTQIFWAVANLITLLIGFPFLLLCLLNISLSFYLIIYGVIFATAALFSGVAVHYIKKNVEEPMRTLGDAMQRVSDGDLSVYLPPVNKPGKENHVDQIYQNFNKMVSDLNNTEILRADFISDISHEFKTPLTSIQYASELLARGDLEKTKRIEYLCIIENSTKRLTALITNILKLNKLEKQVLKPQSYRYDLCQQLCDCVLHFENIWEQKQISFEADMEDQAVICADAGLMELVWNNLLSNAFKFTENGGKVRLFQNTEGENIIVQIQDTGCGMDEKTKKHIFDKFYQGNTFHEREGNGLGMTLVFRVLQTFGFSIDFESELGQGTLFTVRVPLADNVK